MVVNLDTTCLGEQSKQQLATLLSDEKEGYQWGFRADGTPVVLKLSTIERFGPFETINGNHRRVAGDLLKQVDVKLYESMKFSAMVYIDLDEELSWKIASRNILDSSNVLLHNFIELLTATRKVWLTWVVV